MLAVLCNLLSDVRPNDAGLVVASAVAHLHISLAEACVAGLRKVEVSPPDVIAPLAIAHSWGFSTMAMLAAVAERKSALVDEDQELLCAEARCVRVREELQQFFKDRSIEASKRFVLVPPVLAEISTRNMQLFIDCEEEGDIGKNEHHDGSLVSGEEEAIVTHHHVGSASGNPASRSKSTRRYHADLGVIAIDISPEASMTELLRWMKHAMAYNFSSFSAKAMFCNNVESALFHRLVHASDNLLPSDITCALTKSSMRTGWSVQSSFRSLAMFCLYLKWRA